MWWIVAILLILILLPLGGGGRPGPKGPDDLPEEYWKNKRRFK
jgi:hypothetical protein